MYTLQQDSHGNSIVCKGGRERTGYCIVFHGDYAECIRRKFGGAL
jgi:hypothetical protein